MIMQSMGSQRVWHDLETEQQQWLCKGLEEPIKIAFSVLKHLNWMRVFVGSRHWTYNFKSIKHLYSIVKYYLTDRWRLPASQLKEVYPPPPPRAERKWGEPGYQRRYQNLTYMKEETLCETTVSVMKMTVSFLSWRQNPYQNRVERWQMSFSKTT